MPLHDWRTTPHWYSVHQGWAVEIMAQLNERLPAGFRANLGPVPGGGVGLGVPDTPVREEREGTVGDPSDPPATGPFAATFRAEAEAVVADLETETGVFVFEGLNLVTAIELISPGNKDSPEERDAAAARYANYLRGGAHLAVVDVHPSPNRPTLADLLGERFRFDRPPLSAPYVVCYRVGPAGRPGRRVALWSRSLSIGEDLPTIVVPLTGDQAVELDLASTYAAAASAARLPPA